MDNTTISQERLERLQELEKAQWLLSRIEQVLEDADESMTDGELLDAIYEIFP